MVVVGVGNENGVQIFGDLIKEGSRVPAIAARMHAGIQKDRVFPGAEKVGVRPDFRGTRQVGKGNHRVGSNWRGGAKSERAAELG